MARFDELVPLASVLQQVLELDRLGYRYSRYTGAGNRQRASGPTAAAARSRV